MNQKQQQQALKFLKGFLATDDEQNPNETGYCDHADTTKLRLFLIEVGAIPDRRKTAREKTLSNKPKVLLSPPIPMCRAITKSYGLPCHNAAMKDSLFCHQHNKIRQEK